MSRDEQKTPLLSQLFAEQGERLRGSEVVEVEPQRIAEIVPGARVLDLDGV